MLVGAVGRASGWAVHGAGSGRGVTAPRAPGVVARTSEYVPVQPTPVVGQDREPATFARLGRTPNTLGTVDLLRQRPRTSFEAPTDESADGRAGGTPAGTTAEASAAVPAEGASPGEAPESAPAEPNPTRGADGQPLSPEEQDRVEYLKARDQEVRAHEQAHKAAGGRYAGAISYDLQRGPDGRSYAVGGEVSIDVAPIEGDPAGTIRKMQTVRRAALAPAEPSAADRQVAAKASQREQTARAELRTEQADERAAASESARSSDDRGPVSASEPASSAPASSDRASSETAAGRPPSSGGSDGAPSGSTPVVGRERLQRAYGISLA